MPGRPKGKLKRKAEAGDAHAKTLLAELKAAENEEAFMNAIRVQPLFWLRGVEEIRKLPFPSPQARQVVLSAILGLQTVEQIAGLFARPVEELMEHYADEIKYGPTAVVADAMTTAIGGAIMGDAKLLVPFLRARAGLVEPKDAAVETTETTPAQLAEQSAALVGRIIDLVDRTRRHDGAIDVTPKEGK